MAQTALRIDGMTCGGCVRSVQTVLAAVPGVTEVEVDLESGRATVQRPAEVPVQTLVDAVEDAGFGAAPWPTPPANG